jgi:hypothetical protein
MIGGSKACTLMPSMPCALAQRTHSRVSSGVRMGRSFHPAPEPRRW